MEILRSSSDSDHDESPDIMEQHEQCSKLAQLSGESKLDVEALVSEFGAYDDAAAHSLALFIVRQ